MADRSVHGYADVGEQYDWSSAPGNPNDTAGLAPFTSPPQDGFFGSMPFSSQPNPMGLHVSIIVNLVHYLY